MFESALNIHDPADKRSHGILRFFSEDLTENKRIEFVNAIFKRGSWTLATEISRTSHSKRLNEETKDTFLQILDKWVLERIDHSQNKLSEETKNPYLPKKYSYEFREAIIAIKDLDFHPELMLLIEKFINECYRTYIDKFVDGAFWLVIEDFSSLELETFFSYFSSLFIKNSSNNIGDFLYSFLKSLAYSPKIFFLSDNFLQNLNLLSEKIKKLGSNDNHSLLISLLLIELITLKELDLSREEYQGVISPTLNNLESGNLDNLELLSFLNKYNYTFKDYDFKNEIDSFLRSIEVNANKFQEVDEITQNAILHHFVKSSNEYLELLVFQLGFIEENKRIIELKRFVNLIDRLRKSFSKVMWFKEYDNFITIKGKVLKALPDGFGVKLDKCYVNEFLKEELSVKIDKEEYIEDNTWGFSNKRSFRKYSDVNEYYSFLSDNSVITDYNNPNTDSMSLVKLFHISSVNYSSSNKGSVINLIPYNDSTYDILKTYKIKSFFSCIDLFLMHEAYNFLNVNSPFRFGQYSHIISHMLPSTLKSPLRLDLNEDEFWKTLEELRPKLYSETFIKIKEREKQFKELLNIYDQDNIINGTIITNTKGGFYVDIQGYEAFLPGSQIVQYSTPDYDSYIGQNMDFKIVKVYEHNKSIVVSHTVIHEEEVEKRKDLLIANLKKGLKLKGIVKNITSYGAFVDLGGIDGLIHIKDLSWARVNHPNEIVKLNQNLDVLILHINDNKSRIQLGLKQLSKQPWLDISDRLKVGDKVRGKVLVIKDYGAFIEVEEGVEGLLHISEMSWLKISRSAKHFVSLGEIIETQILSIDIKNHKMGLSLKQLLPHPWEGLESELIKGKIIEVQIRKKAKAGLVLEVSEAVQGFAYHSNISKGFYSTLNVGQKVLAKVIYIDFDNNKLRFSVDDKNQTLSNRNLKSKNKVVRVGDVFEGVVIKKNNTTGIIQIKENQTMEIICPSKHMKKKNGEFAEVNDSIKFKLLEIDKNKARLIVSHTATLSN
jgi:small subunit ribosomal protein S1